MKDIGSRDVEYNGEEGEKRMNEAAVIVPSAGQNDRYPYMAEGKKLSAFLRTNTQMK